MAYDYRNAYVIYLACGDVRQTADATGIPFHLVKAKADHLDWPKLRKIAQTKAINSSEKGLRERINIKKISHQHFVLDQLDESEEIIKMMTPLNAEENNKRISYLANHDAVARRTLGLDEKEQDDPVTRSLMLLVSAQTERPERLLTNEKVVELEDKEEEE